MATKNAKAAAWELAYVILTSAEPPPAPDAECDPVTATDSSCAAVESLARNGSFDRQNHRRDQICNPADSSVVASSPRAKALRQIPAKSSKSWRYTGCSIRWCKRPEYLRQGAVSCWGAWSLANTKGIANRDALFSCLNRRAFRILQRQPEFLRQRLHRRFGALPRAFRFEAPITNSPSPRRDDPANG